MRLVLFRLLWTLLMPLRLYAKQDRVTFGRSLVSVPLTALLDVSPMGTFVAQLPSGGRIELSYHEVVGQTFLIRGGFEIAEGKALRDLARRGTIVIDVGANVGLHTVELAAAVGRNGQVWSWEPMPDNLERLRRTVALNGLANVVLVDAAAAAVDGERALNLADDPAYHSLAGIREERDLRRQLTVTAMRLDTFWEENGRPHVSVVKVDTEGTELDVLVGALELIQACSPAIMVEALSSEPFASLLGDIGYSEWRLRGGRWTTHVFLGGTVAQPAGPLVERWHPYVREGDEQP